MIKIYYICCILLLMNSIQLYSKGPKQSIYLQPYQGVCFFTHPDGPLTKAVSLGVAYYPFKKRSLLALTLEQQHGFSTKSYNWPEVGSYKYTRKYNNTAISAGLHLLSTYRLSFTLGLKIYRYTFQGRLKTNNQLIRDYVDDEYFYEQYSVDPFVRFNYRLNYRFSAYTYLHRIISPWTSGKNFISAGLAYNFYGGK
jgi:hypothetical protein